MPNTPDQAVHQPSVIGLCWEKILQIGLSKEMPANQYRRGYAYNLMNFTGLCLSISRLLFMIFLSREPYSTGDLLVNALPIVFCLLLMLWAGLHLYSLTKLFSFLLFPLLLFYIGIRVHDRGVLAYFAPYLIYPFYFLNNRKKILAAFSVSALFFLASFATEIFHHILPTHKHNPPLEIISVIGSLILIFISLRSIKSQTRHYERDLRKQSRALEIYGKSIKRQHEAMLQQRDRLEESNLVKDKLFSIISHDLRVPIQGLQLLFSSEENTEEAIIKLRENLPELRAELARTADLFENLLNWARLQMQDTVLRPQWVNMQELAMAVKEAFVFKAGQKGVGFDIVFPESNAYTDKNMMEIVLRNLVSNAVKYSRKGGTIYVRGILEEDQYLLEVEDEGVGIDKSSLHKIQSKNFYTSPGTKNEIGTGLGLIICKDLVEKCGGDLLLVSTKQAGTIVTIRLPQKNEHKDPSAMQAGLYS